MSHTRKRSARRSARSVESADIGHRANSAVDPIHRSMAVRIAARGIPGRGIPARGIPLRGIPLRGITVSAALMLVLVAATLFSPGAAGAQGDQSGNDVRVITVQFDLAPVPTSDSDPLTAAGSEFEARYRSVVISDGGIEVRLAPLPGPVEVSLTGQDATAMAAEVNGLRIGHATSEFGDALADAVSSSSVHRFARLDAAGSGGPVSVEVTYARPLTTADYLLVQEGGGNGAVDLVALDAAGAPAGVPVRLGPGSPEPNYQWNTGHGPPGESPAWASVVGIGQFQTDQPVAGIRFTGAGAEVKVLALSAGSATGPAVPTPAIPAADPAAAAEPDPSTESAPPTSRSADGVSSTGGGVAQVVSPAAVTGDQAQGELVEVAAPPVAAAATHAGAAPAVESNETPARPADAAAMAPPSSAPPASIQPASTQPPVTQLAMTGTLNEPWILVIFAMGFIFIGYTIYAAFRRQAADGEPCGHDQLDSLGFD